MTHCFYDIQQILIFSRPTYDNNLYTFHKPCIRIFFTLGAGKAAHIN